MRLREAVAVIGAYADQAKARDKGAFPNRRAPRPSGTTRGGGPIIRGYSGTIRIAGSPQSTRSRVTPTDAAEVERLRREFAQYPNLVARHEAGHVVAAWSLGRRVTHVEVGWSGHCGATSLSRGILDPEDALMVLSAGMLAELGSRSWSNDLEKLWPHSDDFERVQDWWRSLNLSRTDEEAARNHLVDRVEETLSRYRRVVDDIAGELQKRRRLDEIDLDLLLPKGGQ